MFSTIAGFALLSFSVPFFCSHVVPFDFCDCIGFISDLSPCHRLVGDMGGDTLGPGELVGGVGGAGPALTHLGLSPCARTALSACATPQVSLVTSSPPFASFLR